MHADALCARLKRSFKRWIAYAPKLNDLGTEGLGWGKLFLGRYIVTDPKICHWKPTFAGTRIMVSQVLEQVAGGMACPSIVGEWCGSVSVDAIGEAARLGERASSDQVDEYARRAVT